ncbi:putative uncharacterized protein [Clostridium sp. CAG:411]|jgi:predicted RNA-binding protein associated with RNAse of E/G family|nr:DUF402 domain-containing protein [Lachnospiraceae bacterium]CDE45171.1 putative uncharacterized protein [Clostridium sp. CAG:411]
MINTKINLYRKRIIPEEMILLKDDVILHQDASTIITKWNSLKPRKDFSNGISAYFMDEGFKVSKIFDKHHKLVYWYCDIIETEYNSEQHTYIFTDLLADVVIYPDGELRVLDLDEIGDALEQKLISKDLSVKALRLCNQLLEKIYAGNFKKYQNIINKYETK